MGLRESLNLTRLKEGLARTRNGLVEKINRLVNASTAIDDSVLESLEEILIQADVGVATTMAVIESIRERVRREGYTSTEELNSLLRSEVARQFQVESGTPDQLVPSASPHVILVVGINGVGKTTTIGKLAHRYVRLGRSVVIGAADTFRAAANEQLAIWTAKAGAELVRQGQGSDPAAVAFDAVTAAAARGADVVIIDTAGRLHTRANLMEELRKIKRVIQRRIPDAPHEVLLVLDATTGQNGIKQASQFHETVGLTGLVITKVDGTAKGGIVLAICRALKIPVRYIGVGESLEDLQPFDPAQFVNAIFEQA
jgi:fused signal recognition particle receptor